MRFDIAIVGAGAAGNMAAYLLSQKGYKTVVLEQNKSIGEKVCGGLVSHRVIQLSKTSSIINEIKGATVFFPCGKTVCIGGNKTHAYVINRKEFDIELAEKAMAEGAIYKLHWKMKTLSNNYLIGKDKITFQYLIGADGAKSRVSKHYNMGKPEYINTMQGQTVSDIDNDFVRIYLNAETTPGFFSYMIPEGNHTRVGLGTNEKGIVQKFNYFVKKQNISVTGAKAAIIPVGLKKMYMDNIVLLGDAAGHVKATSGGGLYGALLAARILADTFDDFSKYKKTFLKKFGSEIKKSLFARRIFLQLKNNDLDYLARYIEEDIADINKHGDMDYQSLVAKQVVKNHPRLVFYGLWKLLT
jgi:geranylgeranyl reductase family protein